MPNYYNPYNFYPASYQPAVPMMNNNMPMTPQQSFSQQPQQSPKMMEWVEGEVGAKAFQMPNGWPANSPIPLWDSTDTVIYLKSWGPMGIPNPMQKLRYEMPEQQNQQLLNAGVSGAANGNQPDMSQFATKQDLESFKSDIMNAMKNSSQNDQNGNNRGGNR